MAGPYGRQIYGLAYQTETHVYVCRSYIAPEIRRFVTSTGREDPNWRSSETFLCGADPVVRRADGSTLEFSSGIYGSFVGYNATASNTSVSVVEYYARNLKRFFITSRPNEIAQLDVMPTNFVRTGMTFAAETALMRSTDATRAPVCHFYSLPDAGGRSGSANSDSGLSETSGH